MPTTAIADINPIYNCGPCKTHFEQNTTMFVSINAMEEYLVAYHSENHPTDWPLPEHKGNDNA